MYKINTDFLCSIIVQECLQGTLRGVPQHKLWHPPSAPSDAMAFLCTLQPSNVCHLSCAYNSSTVLPSLWTVNSTWCIIHPNMHVKTEQYAE